MINELEIIINGSHDEEIDNLKTSISMEDLQHLIEEGENLNLTYQLLVYDVVVYKKIANISFNVMLPLRKTNKIKSEHMIEIGSVTNISWAEYQRLIIPGGNRYCCMVNLFNILQYKFNRPPIKLKSPLDEKKDMPSSRELNLMYEADKNSTDYKECMALLNYYQENK